MRKHKILTPEHRAFISSLTAHYQPQDAEDVEVLFIVLLNLHKVVFDVFYPIYSCKTQNVAAWGNFLFIRCFRLQKISMASYNDTSVKGVLGANLFAG